MEIDNSSENSTSDDCTSVMEVTTATSEETTTGVLIKQKGNTYYSLFDQKVIHVRAIICMGNKCVQLC